MVVHNKSQCTMLALFSTLYCQRNVEELMETGQFVRFGAGGEQYGTCKVNDLFQLHVAIIGIQ